MAPGSNEEVVEVVDGCLTMSLSGVTTSAAHLTTSSAAKVRISCRVASPSSHLGVHPVV